MDDQRQLLNGDDAGPLGLAFLSLMREVWVLKDRQKVLEQVLQDSGVDVAAKLENFTPTGEFEAALAEDRKVFIASVMEHLTSAPSKS